VTGSSFAIKHGDYSQFFAKNLALTRINDALSSIALLLIS
jgi:hypothetical protein